MARTACQAVLLFLAVSCSALLTGPDTGALDALTFVLPSLLTAQDEWTTAVASVASLNDGLWAAQNSSAAEQPWIASPHLPGLETVVNTSCPACAALAVNLTNAGGVATLPTCTAADEGTVFLMKVYGLSYAGCASHCCSSVACAAFAWYVTSDQGTLCQTFSAAYSVGPQPWPAGDVVFAQVRRALSCVWLGRRPPHTCARVCRAAPSELPRQPSTSSRPACAQGLSSAALRPAVTSSCENGGIGPAAAVPPSSSAPARCLPSLPHSFPRADGTTRLSTIRGQSPASEPWQGTVRDAVLAVAVNGEPFAVRLRPFGGLQPVPSLVWASAFPVARLGFLGLALYVRRLEREEGERAASGGHPSAVLCRPTRRCGLAMPTGATHPPSSIPCGHPPLPPRGRPPS